MTLQDVKPGISSGTQETRNRIPMRGFREFLSSKLPSIRQSGERPAGQLAAIVLVAVLAGSALAASPIPDVPLRDGPIPSSPSKIELRQVDREGWRFFVNGEAFPIRGAGGAVEPGLLEHLKAAGGNCVRTWGVDTLEQKTAGGERFVDRAWRLGLMVVPGLWLQHERHGFDYADPARVGKQREEVLAGIRRYKNHPAVLCWGLGNEMEGVQSLDGSEAALREVEQLARLVKAEDPGHPVMSVIAYSEPKVALVKRCCPSLDILGINAYSSASGAGEGLKRVGWTKPFALTEFGVNGPWEVPSTAWGAPLEPTSHEKARSYYATHRMVFELNDGKELCLGTFAFLWGWKQECTATWFGMFLPTLEKLPSVDAVIRAWTGHWPANRCPTLTALASEVAGKTVAPGQPQTARVDVEDPEGDSLTFDWTLSAESTDRKSGGDGEAAPASHSDLIRKNGARDCSFVTPAAAGNYRLYVTVRDGRGGAATANVPFRVATSP